MNKIREFMRVAVPFSQAESNTGIQLGEQFPRHQAQHLSTYAPDPLQVFLSATLEQTAAAPLSLPKTDPYTLPPKRVVMTYLHNFINFFGCDATSESRTASGGIHYWFDSDRLLRDTACLYISRDAGLLGVIDQTRAMDNSALCMVNAVLALASQCAGASGTGSFETEEETLEADTLFWKGVVPEGSPLTLEQACNTTSPLSTADFGEASQFFTAHSFSLSPSDWAGPPTTLSPGITYFARAKALMANPSDSPGLPTLKILSMLSYFLLSANRWEAAYLHIGLAMRLAVSHGLHRARSPHTVISPDDLSAMHQVEEQKRTFWTVYILDRYWKPLFVPKKVRVTFANLFKVCKLLDWPPGYASR